MSKIINGLLAAAALTLLTAAPVMAQVTETLVEGSGWNPFDFGDVFLSKIKVRGADVLFHLFGVASAYDCGGYSRIS